MTMKEAPIGSLGEGFEDRLLLEQQSGLDRALGILSVILAVPFVFFFALLFTALISIPMMSLLSEPNSSPFFMATLVLTFAAMMGWIASRASFRFFGQVSLVGNRLEADGAWLELQDIKIWPYGLFLRASRGRGWQVRCSNELKLKTMESLLPAMVVPHRQRLEAGQEIVLKRELWPLISAALQAAVLGSVVFWLGSFAHPLLGGLLAALVVWLSLHPVRGGFRGAGLILSPTGLRKPGQDREHEVSWREIDSCWSGAFFQNALRITTAAGPFTLISSRNPVVWADLIRQMKEQQEAGEAARELA